MPSQLFARKPLSLIHEEMNGDQRLRRVLGPVSLTALGVGCAIGAGIFVLTGKVASTTTGPVSALPGGPPSPHALALGQATREARGPLPPGGSAAGAWASPGGPPTAGLARGRGEREAGGEGRRG